MILVIVEVFYRAVLPPLFFRRIEQMSKIPLRGFAHLSRDGDNVCPAPAVVRFLTGCTWVRTGSAVHGR